VRLRCDDTKWKICHVSGIKEAGGLQNLAGKSESCLGYLQLDVMACHAMFLGSLS
jgi:hypothetical protein